MSGGAPTVQGPGRRFRELAPAGIGVVGAVAAVLTLNATSAMLFSRPTGEWLVIFAVGFATNAAVGLAILAAAVWARHRFPSPLRTQYAAVFVAVSITAALAILAVWLWNSGGTLGSEDPDWTLGVFLVDFGTGLLQTAVIGLVITGAWLYGRTEDEQSAAIAQIAVDSARMDEQAAEARLQMLEAQIEPHFLFNTLAHVRRLYETDHDGGVKMMANLKRYLAVALPQMRASDSTLGRELDHVRAYLEIQQIRMGPRLEYAIVADGVPSVARVPPLMLLTLVENAIKHGLTPQVGGGRVDVRATIDDGRLRISVSDTGGGFTRSGGGGTGLANIRARLATRFGGDASLTLALNSPTGVIATIVMPCLTAATGAQA
jgi:signal transduction histidine kinase